MLSHVPGFVRGGIGAYDQERELVTLYSFPRDETSSLSNADAIDVQEYPGSAAGIYPASAPHEIYVSPDLQKQRTLLLQESLLGLGVRRYVSVPLRIEDHLLGGIFGGFATPDPVPDDVQAFFRQMAKIVAPILWNCHTYARFEHGDRRRDALIELSDAINTSLKLEAVLASARDAIRRLSGHVFSSINVLADDRESYHSYDNPPPDEHAAGGGQRVPARGTVLEWMLKERKTYESDDLAAQTRFMHDERLVAAGVRRYVAAPMFVRGRIIGCFLMGSSDPRRTLRIDVWLYENIALQLALAIDNAQQLDEVRRLSARLAEQNVYLREEIETEHTSSAMIGKSAGIARVQEAIARVAAAETTVLILGETGVGKELVARALHESSPRAAQPMVKINCAAIPEGMVESELFGHEKGAFTSAVARRIGRFELARDGTLFLDEVGELPLGVQAKLLRVLQDGEFERVGGTKTLTSNARIIAATNRDLMKSVNDGTFRHDLFYRLNVFPIAVPALRDRPDDIPLLAEAFVAQFNRRMGKRVAAIDDAALSALQRRSWPGNVRELRHVIERAMILCDGPVLYITDEGPAATVTPPAAHSVETAEIATLREAEARHIRRALEHTGGVVEGPKGAAALLDLNPSTLRFRIKRLGIRRPGT